MINLLYHFFLMGGYGFYVWIAYGCAFLFLSAQWFFAWRRFRLYLNKQKSS